MNRLKKVLGVFLAVTLMIIAIPIETMADTPTGDIAMNPIRMKQSEKLKTSFTKDKSIKYFTIVVEEAGSLKINYESTKMKKAVELSFDYGEGLNQFETKKIKYDKKKKVAKGSISTEQTVQPGVYKLCVTASGPASIKTAFTITTSLKAKKYDDKEPNNNSDTAQEMVVGSNPKTYSMNLSGTSYAPDVMDCFKFTLTKSKTVTITASTNTEADMVILLKKKTDKGEETINSGNQNQSFAKSGNKYVFKYTSEKLEKGDYTVTVWLREGINKQIEYTISAKAK